LGSIISSSWPIQYLQVEKELRPAPHVLAVPHARSMDKRAVDFGFALVSTVELTACTECSSNSCNLQIAF